MSLARLVSWRGSWGHSAPLLEMLDGAWLAEAEEQTAAHCAAIRTEREAEAVRAAAAKIGAKVAPPSTTVDVDVETK